jgi:hypothetical protein
MTTRQPDWARIEPLFQTDLLSVCEIASACGVSHGIVEAKAAARAAAALVDVFKRAAAIADQARTRRLTCEQAYDGLGK